MADGLRAGGAPMVIRRDLGTPAAVQNLRASGSPQYGANRATALVGTVLMRAQDGIASMYYQVAAATIAYIKIAGTWKQANVWTKVSGVWKQTTPFIKIGGNWK